MQDNVKPLPDARTSDPAITTWWAPALPATAHPTLVDIPNERIPPPPPPPADASFAITLMVLGIVFAPFAWACWAYAGGQLELIDRGERSTEGRGAIVIARGVAAAVTLVGLAVLSALVLHSCGRAR